MKKKYNKVDEPEIKDIYEDIYEPPIVHEVPSKMTIYDAWRSNKITLQEYQKWLKDGYPKNLLIKVK